MILLHYDLTAVLDIDTLCGLASHAVPLKVVCLGSSVNFWYRSIADVCWERLKRQHGA